MSQAHRRPHARRADVTGRAEVRSEFLDAMREAADILTGKLAPVRVHTPETLAIAPEWPARKVSARR